MSAPTYPLTFPTTQGVQKSSWGLQRAVGISTSPFTGSQQVYEHDFALWKATITLPPMNRATSAEYQTFFMQLHGRKGTFLMGDPDGKTQRGNATQSSITIASNTAIGAYDIPVSGLTNSQSNALVKGDYIQFGTGSSAKLHMIMDNASASGSGTVTLKVEPALKVAITTSTSCVITNTVGVWRMDTNDLNWDSNHASIYGFSFSCMEAI
tara:strand:+ start:2335 stop:2964 length:630 start_codon:yes stop_codon:yes gene_type:complete